MRGQADIRDVEKCKKILKAVEETGGSVQGQLRSSGTVGHELIISPVQLQV